MKGKNITTPMKLNIKWAIATLFPFMFVIREATSEVPVVPIFEPKIIPKAWPKAKSPPDANTITRPMVTELDCKIVEIIIPIIIAIYKLELFSRKKVIVLLSLNSPDIIEITSKQVNTRPK